MARQYTVRTASGIALVSAVAMHVSVAQGQPAEPSYVALEFDSPTTGLELHHVVDTRTGVHLVVMANGAHAARAYAIHDTALICRAPCRVRVPVGNYRLGLARPGGDTIVAPRETNLFADSRLLGEIESRGDMRAVGVAVAILGSVLGASAMATTLALAFAEPDLPIEAAIAGAVSGAVVLSISLPVGLALAFTSDVPLLRIHRLR